MDIYQATQALLEDAVGEGVNVSAYVLTYNELTKQFDLPQFPAVTYNYTNIAPIVAHDGTSSLYRVNLEITVWGDLEQIDNSANAVMGGINAQRIAVNNVEFTVAIQTAQDVADLGLDFKRRVMRFVGLVVVGEDENEQDSL